MCNWNEVHFLGQVWIRAPPLAYLFRRRQQQPTPVLLPGKSHGRRSLVGCSPWGRKQSDMTERLHFHFSLSCIGEGNGNPLQCSCLENPRDGGAWCAAVYGSHRVGHDWSDLAAAAAATVGGFMVPSWSDKKYSKVDYGNDCTLSVTVLKTVESC